MRIGIIGAGWFGGTVRRVWVTAGHDVMFSFRHPFKFDDLVRTLGADASAGRRRKPLCSVRSSSSPCLTELPKIGRGLGHLLDSKIVLDSCNPYFSETEEMRREVLKEGVAIASARYLPGTRLVRALSAGDATSVQDSAAGATRGSAFQLPVTMPRRWRSSSDWYATPVASRSSWAASQRRAAFSAVASAFAPIRMRRLCGGRLGLPEGA
jgi:predicted dinucleotide-binding enzyme